MFRNGWESLASAMALAGAALFAAGCGVSSTAVPNGPMALSIGGRVHGGQQPVVGATIGLYRAGTSGFGSGATQVLTQAVTTDSNGYFTITGLYSCNATDDQMYLVATQGNPGLGAGGNNPALTMVAALGNCGDLLTPRNVWINEVTTVGAAWALAQFAKDYQHVGTTATNTLGLKHAFLNAGLLANSTTGAVATSTNRTIESQKLVALANALASCVNSDGSGPCTSLFSVSTPSGGSAPTDTFTAALNIVKNPSANVSAVFSQIQPQAPFSGGLTTAPHDWTMSMTISGSGLRAPTGLGVDSQGMVWVAGYYGVLSGFTAQGAGLSASGFGVGTLSESYGLTIDTDDNVWVPNEESPWHNGTYGSLTKLQGNLGGAPGTVVGTYYDNSIDYPIGIAADSNGTIDIANYANSTYTVYNKDGSVAMAGQSGRGVAFPVSIAPDSNHGVWMGEGSDRGLSHYDSTGAVVTSTVCCYGVSSVALDSAGNAWTANYYGEGLSMVSAAGVLTVDNVTTGGVYKPNSVFVDGAQNVWTANYRGASISSFAGIGSTSSVGTARSPSTGWGLDANLLEPFAVRGDAAGNLWVSNYGNDDVVMFFGLATPTKTPVFNTPSLP